MMSGEMSTNTGRSEREPADSVGDESNVTGGGLPSLALIVSRITEIMATPDTSQQSFLKDIDPSAVSIVVDQDVQEPLGTGFYFLQARFCVTAKHVVVHQETGGVPSEPSPHAKRSTIPPGACCRSAPFSGFGGP